MYGVLCVCDDVVRCTTQCTIVSDPDLGVSKDISFSMANHIQKTLFGISFLISH